MDNSNVNFNEIIEKVQSLTNRSFVQSMPPCAEKTILNLQINIAEMFYISRAILDLKVFLANVQTFEDQIIEESLSSDKISIKCKKLKEILNKSQGQIKGDIVKETFYCVTSLLPEIRTIDSNLLYHILQETLKTSSKLIDKDVILILGKTGSGKTATIQFLGGSNFSIDKDSRRVYDSYIISSFGNEEMRSFIISNNLKSETIVINAVDIEFNGLVYTLCDTPGFGENRGVEIDISNTLGIAAATRKCRSVRILLLSSQLSMGDKADGIVEDLQTMSLFIKDVSTHLASYTYWFTKFSKDKNENLSSYINDKKITISADEVDIIALLNDMSEKCSIEKGGAVILDPIYSDRILLLQNIIDTEPIVNPNEDFQTFTSNKNLMLLKNQLNQHVHSIDSAINKQRLDIVEYKLNHLLTMQLVVDMPEFTDKYKNCVNKIYQIVVNLRVKLVGELSKLKNDENNYIKDDLLVLSNDIIELLKFENIRENHFPTMPSFVDACLLEICNICQQWSESISNKLNILKDTSNGGLNLNYDSNLVSQTFVTLRKLKCLVDIFGDTFIKYCNEALNKELDIRILQIIHSNCMDHFMKIVVDASQNCKDYLEQDEFIYALHLLSFLKLLTNEWNITNETSQLMQCSRLFINRLQECFSQVINLFSSNDLNIVSEESLKIIFKSFGLITYLNNKKDWLLDLFDGNLAGINESNDLLTSKLNQYVLSKHQTIKAIIDTEGHLYTNLVVIRKLFDIMSPLWTVLRGGQLFRHVYKEYCDIKTTIKSYINSLRERLSQDINLMRNGHWIVDLQTFFNIIEIIQESSCIYELDDSIQSDNDVVVLVEEFRQLLLSQQTKIKNTDLSYKNPQLTLSLVESINMVYEITLIGKNNIVLSSILDEKDVKQIDNIRKTEIVNNTFAKAKDVTNYFICHVCSEGLIFTLSSRVQCHSCKGSCHAKCSKVLKMRKKKTYLCNNCEQNDEMNNLKNFGNPNVILSINLNKTDKIQPSFQNVNLNLADISQGVIAIFKEKVNHQIQLAYVLFPVDEDIDVERYYINFKDFWIGIEFLLILKKFKFKFEGLGLIFRRIDDFISNHFRQKSILLNSKYELALSNSTDLNSKAELLSFITVVIKYIIKFRRFYENNRKYLMNQTDEYHYLVFFKSTSAIYSEWLENEIPSIHKRMNNFNRKDYSAVSFNLILAQAFSLLDSLIPFPDCKFESLKFELEWLLKEMTSSIEVYINNCRYDKVVEFFINQNNNYNSTNITVQLTSSIDLKLKSLNSKISNNSKFSEFELFQLELTQLRSARDTVLEYLNESMRNCLPKRIENIVKKLFALLLSKLAIGASNDDFGIREKVFQTTLKHYRALICDSNGNITSDSITHDDLPSIVLNYRNQIKSFVQSEMRNFNNIFEVILNYVKSLENERLSYKSDFIDRNLFISQQLKEKVDSNHIKSAKPLLDKEISSSIDQVRKINSKILIAGLENATKYGEPLYYNELITFITQVINDNVDKIFFLLTGPIDSSNKILLLNFLNNIMKYVPFQAENNIASYLTSQSKKEKIERENVESDLRISNNFINILSKLKNYFEDGSYDYYIIAANNLKNHLSNFLENHVTDLNNGKLFVVLNQFPRECEIFCDYFMFCHNIHRCNLFHNSILTLDTDNENKLFKLIENVGSKVLGDVFATIPQVNTTKIEHDIFKSIGDKLDIIICLMISYGISSQPFFWDIIMKKYPSFIDDTVLALVNIIALIEMYSNLINSELMKPRISFKKLNSLLCIYKDSDYVIDMIKKIVISNSNIETFSIFLPIELNNRISKFTNYHIVLNDINDIIISKVGNCNIHFDHNLILNPSNSDRRDYYKDLVLNFSNLKSSLLIQPHFDLSKFNIRDYINNSENFISNQISYLKDDGQLQIYLMFSDPSNPKLDVQNCINLNIYFDNFQNALEIFSTDNSTKSLGNISKKCLDNLTTSFRACLSSYKQHIQNNFKGNPNELIKCLECLKMCSCNIDICQIFADNLIDSILDCEEDSTNIGIIKIINDNPNNQYYQMLQQHNKFEDSLSKIWEDYISRFTIEQVLDRKYGMKVSRDSNELSDWELNSIQSKLRELFNHFDQRYTDLVNDGIVGMNRKSQMSDIICSAQNALFNNSLEFVEKILELMACLFSYWTLSKIKSKDQDLSFDSDSPNSIPNSSLNTEASHASVLIKPHPGQIIALLRIFGLDSPSEEIDNHIIEILTGEGKSIVLGVTATILALLGYSVDCVCYSSYLSKRDNESFSYLFNAFGVDKFINYGTLTELCEKTVEDLAGGSIRDNVLRSLGINSSGSHKFSKSNRRKVLLMDEVDMFFNDDFYGNAYTPVARLVDPTITDVVNYIWSIREDPKNFNISKVLKSNQFIACKNRFHQYSSVIEESVKYMFFQLKELLDDAKAGREPSPAHVPYVLLDSIAYKDQDSLSSNISLGYKTMWTYFIENSKKNITDKSRDSQICIRLDCGQYSIAEVPKLYEFILGVSGTITALTNDKVLTEVYNIHKETKIPSVYGENKLRFTTVGNNADIKISTEVSHFIDITNEITKQSEVEIDGNEFHRPVLVFFESIAELNKYYNSPSAQKNKNRTKILTEKEPDTSKTNLIRHATNANTITLLTREFGRGIDFIVYDEKVRKAGGPHVIQSFFSEGISEEIQIKGRAARQGGEGSYSMVLSLGQLEKFKSGSESLMSLFDSKVYGPVLDNLRIQYIDSIRGSMALRVKSCMPQHDKSLEFIHYLVTKNVYKITEYLELFNKCPSEYLVNTETRILVLMDATGSMSSCITKAKNAVGEMFKQIQTVLKENNVDSLFEIQFAVYRNYNAPMDKIIEWSEWTSNPSVLYSFIEKIKAKFGYGDTGNEAVEMGLWHLNKEIDYDINRPIDRVILIGDQPPNTPVEVERRRQSPHGEAYWISKKIGPATTYLDQLNLIQQKNENIMINSFYLNGYAARTVFTEIAEATGGVCKSLDVTDVAKAAQYLCGHTAINILDAINNNSTKVAKGQLVAAYKQMFKGYIQ